MKGYVYILTNESMPGLLKIGRTTRCVDARAAELYQTGVPTPFDIAHSVYSPDCVSLERTMHGTLHDCRVGDGREFFRCEAGSAMAVLDSALFEQVDALVQEFTEGHILVEEPFYVDPGEIFEACQSTDVHPYDFASLVRFLDPQAVQDAAGRMMAHRARMKELSSQVVVSIHG